MLLRLVRAHRKAAAFIEDEANREEVGRHPRRAQPHRRRSILAVPNRADVAAEVIRRTLDGRMKVSPDGTVRTDKRYLLVGRERAARPDPAQTAWLYAQMVRWGQAPLSQSCWPLPRPWCARTSTTPPCPARSLVGRRAGRWHWRLHGAGVRSSTTSPDTSHTGPSSATLRAMQRVLAALHTISAACGGNGQDPRARRSPALCLAIETISFYSGTRVGTNLVTILNDAAPTSALGSNAGPASNAADPRRRASARAWGCGFFCWHGEEPARRSAHRRLDAQRQGIDDAS